MKENIKKKVMRIYSSRRASNYGRFGGVEVEKVISDEELSSAMKEVATMKGVVATIGRTTLLELLHELKGCRESSLRPATKFENLDIEECVCNKVLEEFFEVYAACRDGNNENLAEELVDLQMVCETALWRLGLDESQRRAVRKAVIKKNRERGYYIVKGD